MLENQVPLPAAREAGAKTDAGATTVSSDIGKDLSAQILSAIEHGLIVWSAEGVCQTFNDIVCDLLELPVSALRPDTQRKAFYASAIGRGEEFSIALADINAQFDAKRPFQFERTVPSGRIVAARVRPLREGGHIVVYSDVTAERHAVQALELAQAEAEAAQRHADAVLMDERKRQREAARMSRLDEWLQSCKSLDELYRIVTAFMLLVMPATRGQLFIYSNSRDVLVCECTWNLETQQDHVTPDSCWALRRGRNYIFELNNLCFHCDHVNDRGVQQGDVEKYLCVPIVAHGDTVGLLHLQFMTDGVNPDVAEPVAFATACGEHISMAIANVKLRDELQDQSSRDPLTGLFNRRYFLEAMRSQLMYASSHQNSFALLSVDADKFKQFNDDHGHDAGDQVLEALAERMANLEVEDAVACRLGGEEFAILLPNADRTRASHVAEELRSSISEMRVNYVGGLLPKITVSIGIAIYPTHGTDGKDLIKQSDIALYAAKRAGRNCWKIAEGDGMITFE